METDFSRFEELFCGVFSANGLGEYAADRNISAFYRLADLLSVQGKSVNLTSITEAEEMIVKHFADCAKAARYIPQNASVIDVGCGAGFPSLPLSIIRPDISVTALDSTSKKIDFVRLCAHELGLEGLAAISARAEDFAQQNREKFDVSISRAVARLNIIMELCLPLVKTGGIFIAMKGKNGSEEQKEAVSAAKVLCSELSCEDSFVLNDFASVSAGERKIFVYTKSKPTPQIYPRNYSRIVKKPL